MHQFLFTYRDAPEDFTFETALNVTESQELWTHFAPILELHSIVLFNTPAYDAAPLPPRCPPSDSFHPKDTEDFVPRLRTPSKMEKFSQRIPSGYLGIDPFGRNVHVKAVQTSSSEHRIVDFLSSPELRSDPWNHTIPYVSTVAWWGRWWTSPPIDALASRLSMVLDLMEDLTFMHEHNVAHGDILPDSFAPTINVIWLTMTLTSAAQSNSRAVTSDHHVQRQPTQPPLEFAAPEQISESEGSYDMFAADIYNLGKVLEHAFEVPFDISLAS
ncbi:hypothetical protein C8J56DRAFT_1134531 [Mycena floridula]|nr:hypothetical protein C8J56DRAFT_1134531 [Mycena floridula]